MVEDDLDKFGTWLSQTSTIPQTTAILIISHHDANKLVFNPLSEVPAVFSTNISSRTFLAPSFAIIDACGTADPGAFDFVRELNRAGVNSMIATSTEVDGTMAGQFASLLMDLIHQHESEAAYTLDVAKFDAVNH